MEIIYCVMKKNKSGFGEDLVMVFATKDLANEYVSIQHEQEKYRISQRKIVEKF